MGFSQSGSCSRNSGTTPSSVFSREDLTEKIIKFFENFCYALNENTRKEPPMPYWIEENDPVYSTMSPELRVLIKDELSFNYAFYRNTFRGKKRMVKFIKN